MKQSKSSSLEQASIIFLAIIIGAIILLSNLIRPTEQYIWAPSITNHQSSISPLWMRQNVYINKYDQPQMVSIGGKLLIIGSDTSDSVSSLFAFDGATGATIWKYGNNNELVITASSSKLFVGEVGSVVALNPIDGKIIWDTNLPLTRSVTKVLVRDKILHVDTVSGNHFLLDSDTGKILQSISYAIDNAPNESIPDLSNHKMNLEFVENISFFQKQIGWPNVKEVEIVATDENSDNQLWSLTLPLVGRAAFSPLGVFTLQKDGKLLHIDPISGVSKELIQFDSALAQRYYYDDGSAQDYGYFVTVNNESQMIFVYLGDSRQLFAFKLSMP